MGCLRMETPCLHGSRNPGNISIYRLCSSGDVLQIISFLLSLFSSDNFFSCRVNQGLMSRVHCIILSPGVMNGRRAIATNELSKTYNLKNVPYSAPKPYLRKYYELSEFSEGKRETVRFNAWVATKQHKQHNAQSYCNRVDPSHPDSFSIF